MKTNLLSIQADKLSEMRQKIAAKLLLLFLLLSTMFLNKAFASEIDGLKTYRFPIEYSGDVSSLEQMGEVTIKLDFLNPKEIVAVRVLTIFEGQHPIKDAEVAYGIDGRIDVDIIIRATASIKDKEIPIPTHKDPSRFLLGIIEVITVDNISGVTPSDNTVFTYRVISNLSLNGDNNSESNSNNLNISITPIQNNGKGDKSEVKLKSDELSNLLTLFPNPSLDGNVRIKSKFEAFPINQIQVYNIAGGMMKNQMISNRLDEEIMLDLADLNKGVYFIKIITPYGETIKKLNLIK